MMKKTTRFISLLIICYSHIVSNSSEEVMYGLNDLNSLKFQLLDLKDNIDKCSSIEYYDHSNGARRQLSEITQPLARLAITLENLGNFFSNQSLYVPAQLSLERACPILDLLDDIGNINPINCFHSLGEVYQNSQKNYPKESIPIHIKKLLTPFQHLKLEFWLKNVIETRQQNSITPETKQTLHKFLIQFEGNEIMHRLALISQNLFSELLMDNNDTNRNWAEGYMDLIHQYIWDYKNSKNPPQYSTLIESNSKDFSETSSSLTSLPMQDISTFPINFVKDVSKIISPLTIQSSPSLSLPLQVEDSSTHEFPPPTQPIYIRDIVKWQWIMCTSKSSPSIHPSPRPPAITLANIKNQQYLTSHFVIDQITPSVYDPLSSQQNQPPRTAVTTVQANGSALLVLSLFFAVFLGIFGILLYSNTNTSFSVRRKQKRITKKTRIEQFQDYLITITEYFHWLIKVISNPSFLTDIKTYLFQFINRLLTTQNNKRNSSFSGKSFLAEWSFTSLLKTWTSLISLILEFFYNSFSLLLHFLIANSNFGLSSNQSNDSDKVIFEDISQTNTTTSSSTSTTTTTTTNNNNNNNNNGNNIKKVKNIINNNNTNNNNTNNTVSIPVTSTILNNDNISKDNDNSSSKENKDCINPTITTIIITPSIIASENSNLIISIPDNNDNNDNNIVKNDKDNLINKGVEEVILSNSGEEKISEIKVNHEEISLIVKDPLLSEDGLNLTINEIPPEEINFFGNVDHENLSNHQESNKSKDDHQKKLFLTTSNSLLDSIIDSTSIQAPNLNQTLNEISHETTLKVQLDSNIQVQIQSKVGKEIILNKSPENNDNKKSLTSNSNLIVVTPITSTKTSVPITPHPHPYLFPYPPTITTITTSSETFDIPPPTIITTSKSNDTHINPIINSDSNIVNINTDNISTSSFSTPSLTSSLTSTTIPSVTPSLSSSLSLSSSSSSSSSSLTTTTTTATPIVATSTSTTTSSTTSTTTSRSKKNEKRNESKNSKKGSETKSQKNNEDKNVNSNDQNVIASNNNNNNNNTVVAQNSINTHTNTNSSTSLSSSSSSSSTNSKSKIINNENILKILNSNNNVKKEPNKDKLNTTSKNEKKDVEEKNNSKNKNDKNDSNNDNKKKKDKERYKEKEKNEEETSHKVSNNNNNSTFTNTNMNNNNVDGNGNGNESKNNQNQKVNNDNNENNENSEIDKVEEKNVVHVENQFVNLIENKNEYGNENTNKNEIENENEIEIDSNIKNDFVSENNRELCESPILIEDNKNDHNDRMNLESLQSNSNFNRVDGIDSNYEILQLENLNVYETSSSPEIVTLDTLNILESDEMLINSNSIGNLLADLNKTSEEFIDQNTTSRLDNRGLLFPTQLSISRPNFNPLPILNISSNNTLDNLPIENILDQTNSILNSDLPWTPQFNEFSNFDYEHLQISSGLFTRQNGSRSNSIHSDSSSDHGTLDIYLQGSDQINNINHNGLGSSLSGSDYLNNSRSYPISRINQNVDHFNPTHGNTSYDDIIEDDIYSNNYYSSNQMLSSNSTSSLRYSTSNYTYQNSLDPSKSSIGLSSPSLTASPAPTNSLPPLSNLSLHSSPYHPHSQQHQHHSNLTSTPLLPPSFLQQQQQHQQHHHQQFQLQQQQQQQRNYGPNQLPPRYRPKKSPSIPPNWIPNERSMYSNTSNSRLNWQYNGRVNLNSQGYSVPPQSSVPISQLNSSTSSPYYNNPPSHSSIPMEINPNIKITFTVRCIVLPPSKISQVKIASSMFGRWSSADSLAMRCSHINPEIWGLTIEIPKDIPRFLYQYLVIDINGRILIDPGNPRFVGVGENRFHIGDINQEDLFEHGIPSVHDTYLFT